MTARVSAWEILNALMQKGLRHLSVLAGTPVTEILNALMQKGLRLTDSSHSIAIDEILNALMQKGLRRKNAFDLFVHLKY